MRALPRTLAALLALAALTACAADEPIADAGPLPGADPSLNAGFTSDDLDVQSYIDRFETESREVAAERDALVEVMAIRPGERVADIGAGTGLFVGPFDRAVGPTGRNYAVDISPGFVEHLEQRIAEEGLSSTEPVLCSPTSTHLPADSVDAVFICDTYHHFEYPADTLRSIRRALRRGGRMVIVDFERIEGVSSEWLLNHVRCGKETVIEEVLDAGFVLDEEIDVPGLTENYVLRFTKR